VELVGQIDLLGEFLKLGKILEIGLGSIKPTTFESL